MTNIEKIKSSDSIRFSSLIENPNITINIQDEIILPSKLEVLTVISLVLLFAYGYRP